MSKSKKRGNSVDYKKYVVPSEILSMVDDSARCERPCQSKSSLIRMASLLKCEYPDVAISCERWADFLSEHSDKDIYTV